MPYPLSFKSLAYTLSHSSLFDLHEFAPNLLDELNFVPGKLVETATRTHCNNCQLAYTGHFTKKLMISMPVAGRSVDIHQLVRNTIENLSGGNQCGRCPASDEDIDMLTGPGPGQWGGEFLVVELDRTQASFLGRDKSWWKDMG